MTKEDIADILLCIGNALRGFSSSEPEHVADDEITVAETGTIELAPELAETPVEPTITVPETKPLAIEVPDMSSKIKEIFDNQNLDPHTLALQAKEREIQLLKSQLQNLQNSNQQPTTGSIG